MEEKSDLVSVSPAVMTMIENRRMHDEIKAQNERIINGQMITQQLLRELIESQKKTNDLLNKILIAD